MQRYWDAHSSVWTDSPLAMTQPAERSDEHTGWFRRKCQYFGRWYYRSLWGEKKFVWTCVQFWMATEIQQFGSTNTRSLWTVINKESRSQWPRGLRRRSAAARLLRTWVRIPPGAWIFVCCECRVLSGRGLCDELITRPEESYRLWCVFVFDLETSRMRAWPALGRRATENK